MPLHIVIITGESGAGKSTVLKALEDLDYLAIENFPIRLLIPFIEEIENIGTTQRLAFVIDLRDPHFLSEFSKVFSEIKKMGHFFDILYLTADTEVLIARFNQTRRPHPLMKELKDLRKAIIKEKEMMMPLKEHANIFLNTSQFNVHQLRHQIFTLYGKREDLDRPFLHIITFGFKYGIPSEANYIFDVRILPNPYFIPELNPLTGVDPQIREYLLKSERTEELLNSMIGYLKWVIPLHWEEGRKFIVIGIGCTGGRHRSPAIAHMLKERIREVFSDLEVVITHRDVERG